MTMIKSFFTDYTTISHVFFAIVYILVGFLIAGFAKKAIERFAKKFLDKQQLLLLKRLVYYVLLIIFFLAAMQELGFKISVLLGTAGVVTVALSFAAQTSLSNLISGVFLFMEKPFVLGDTISVSGFSGELLSIDLFSIKLRTVDNQYVRVPNQTVINSPVSNLTRYTQRCLTITLAVPFHADLSKITALLLALANENPQCSKTPAPSLGINTIINGNIQLALSVWTNYNNFSQVQTVLQQGIQQAFLEHDIEVAVPLFAKIP